MIAGAQLGTTSRGLSGIVQRCDLLRPLPIQTLRRDYWRFLSASVFFDFGFGLFFFMFNLYLAAEHFDERSIGFFTSAFALGSLMATLPAGVLAKRIGLRPLLAVCLLGAPLAGAIRVFSASISGQWIASFFFGVTMCGWAVCTPTVLARLTEPRNRSVGFSLNFAVGIGTGVAAGYIGGHVPAHMMQSGFVFSIGSAMRVTLLLACAVVALGVLPLTRRRFLAHKRVKLPQGMRQSARTSYLRRFLLAFGTWSAVSAAFSPFAGLYMARILGLPLARIGEVFAASQFVQVLAVLSTPILNRHLGVRRTVIAIQSCCGALLLLISVQRRIPVLIVCLIMLSALQYMAGPNMYALLMANTPDPSRSTAAAAQSTVAASTAIIASSVAGIIVFRSGYQMLFACLAAVALASALLFGLAQIETRDE